MLAGSNYREKNVCYCFYSKLFMDIVICEDNTIRLIEKINYFRLRFDLVNSIYSSICLKCIRHIKSESYLYIRNLFFSSL